MSEELKPCPFCRSKARVREKNISPIFGEPYIRYRIRCDGCMVSSGWYDSAAGAIEAWNRRIDSKELSALRKVNERLGDCNKYPFQSAVSGLWYSDIKAAGDIATFRINGKLYRTGAEEDLVELEAAK